MSDTERPSAEEIILYDKDPRTRIATITFNRPDQLNAPTIAARLRYADLLQRANIDDDVKVLVIRGVGDDLGSGADVPEVLEATAAPTDGPVLREWGLEEGGPVYSADATSGSVLVTDGPYVETKEFLGGFAVVDVPDDEAAKVWAGRIAQACGWPHEVRRFGSLPDIG